MCEITEVPFIINNSALINLDAHLKSQTVKDTHISLQVDKYLFHFTKMDDGKYDKKIYEYECFVKKALEYLYQELKADDAKNEKDIENDIITGKFRLRFNFYGFIYEVRFNYTEDGYTVKDNAFLLFI